MVPNPAKITSVSLADERANRNEAAAFFHQMPRDEGSGFFYSLNVGESA
jgi:hypothetical protein